MEAAYTGGRRIIVSMPPRHGKSELCSHHFPAWYLDQFPARNIMLASYGSELATDWGRKVRNTIAESRELSVRLAEDSKAANRWNTPEGGGMISIGVDGGATGRGAHLFLIDDPVKNWEEAYSSTQRKHVWDWYASTAYTRLEPDASVVLVMTRWHEDDLAGRLIREMSKGGEQWDVVRVPAIAEDKDVLGRQPGEPLWQWRYNLAALERIKRAVGPFVWAGLFQQSPIAAESSLFPEAIWRQYDEAPKTAWFDRIVLSWDMALKDLKSSDYVVGQAWGFKGAQAYLLDLVRDRMNFDRIVNEMRSMCQRWPTAGAKYVEDTANGPAVISHLDKEIPGLVAVTPKGSKEARAAAVQPFAAAGNVWIPNINHVGWVRDFTLELQAFPTGANDDQVDAFSQALSQVWLLEGVSVTNLRLDENAGFRGSVWRP